jgi:hypothetical protein
VLEIDAANGDAAIVGSNNPSRRACHQLRTVTPMIVGEIEEIRLGRFPSAASKNSSLRATGEYAVPDTGRIQRALSR